MWGWAVPIGLGIAAALMFTRQGRGHRPVVPMEDAEYLARVAILETGGGGPPEEWAGVMNVALNRAEHRGQTVRQVVTNCNWPGCSSRGRAFVEAVAAPGGVGYRSEHGHGAPPDHRNWPMMMAFAQQVIIGAVENPIGPRRHFFHPGGMPSCGELAPGEWNESGSRICVEGKLWPRWSMPQYAEYPPMRVGRAVFS